MAKDVFELRAKIDELDMLSHRIVQKFPRHERHVLAAEIRTILGNIIRYEIRASQVQASETRRAIRPMQTLDILQRMDAEVGLLKRQIQKSVNLDYLKSQSSKTHEVWAGLASEVGKLLGSWIKTVENRAYPFNSQEKSPPRQGLLK